MQQRKTEDKDVIINGKYRVNKKIGVGKYAEIYSGIIISDKADTPTLVAIKIV